jgi:hypothetical protein
VYASIGYPEEAPNSTKYSPSFEHAPKIQGITVKGSSSRPEVETHPGELFEEQPRRKVLPKQRNYYIQYKRLEEVYLRAGHNIAGSGSETQDLLKLACFFTAL